MKILLTNDDGIEAPGLAALEASVRTALGDSVEIFVVAPDRGRSECGHSVTTGHPLTFDEVRPGRVALGGTPVDCVRATLSHWCPQIQMVLSGVNAGANLGVDLLVSGTFAAAREASIHGIPAMAISHYRRPDVPVTWDHVPGWLADTLREFHHRVASADEAREPMLWNVNLPAIDPAAAAPEPIRCDVDGCPMERSGTIVESSLHFESDFHGRPRVRDRDVARCFSGQMTISEFPPVTRIF